jgi:predicted enzyme related to lactoylglutathione lyase
MLKKSISICFLLIISLACNDKQGEKISKSIKSTKEKTMSNEEPRVTGIGGIFFKTENPNQTKQWYQKNLGLNTDKWGTNFEWYQGRDSTKKGFTQWSPFNKETKYFEPSEKGFMINYRVVHLEKLLEKLRINGVKILDSIEEFEYGKFIHIMDNDGNKIELWEPNDMAYEKLVEGRTK